MCWVQLLTSYNSTSLYSCTLVLLYLFGLKDSGQAEGSTLCSLVCGDDIQQAVVVLSGVSWDMWLIWELEKEIHPAFF